MSNEARFLALLIVYALLSLGMNDCRVHTEASAATTQGSR